MDTCDRYTLHEMYKARVKDMLHEFSYDLFIEIEKDDHAQLFDCYDFIDEWIEDHIRPAIFEEENDNV